MKAVIHVDLGKSRTIVSLYGGEGRLVERVECDKSFVRLRVRGEASILAPPTLSTGYTVLVVEGDRVKVRCGHTAEVEVGGAAGSTKSGEEQE